MSFFVITKHKIIFFVMTVSLLAARGFLLLSDKTPQPSFLKTKNDQPKGEPELIHEPGLAGLQSNIKENVPRKVTVGNEADAKGLYRSYAGVEENHLIEKNQKNTANKFSSAVKTRSVTVGEESRVLEPSVAVEHEKEQVFKKDRFYRHSMVNIEAGAGYSLLEGSDPRDGTSGRLLSELSPQVLIAWRQIWSEKFSSKIFLGMSSINFQPEESGLNLKNSSIMKSHFGIGFGSEISGTIHGFLDVGIEQTLFYQGRSGGGIEINRVPLLKITPGLSWVLINREPFSIEFLGSVSYWSNSVYDSYSIDQGSGFNAGFSLAQKQAISEFYCTLNYHERSQNSSILNLNEKEVGLFCGLEWSVGL